MNFENNYFDIIVCFYVLEHIKDYRRATREMFRVLKLEGIIILQVPISKAIYKTLEDFSISTSEER